MSSHNTVSLKEKIENVSIPIIIGIILTLVGFFDNNTEKGKRKNYVVGGISLVIISFIIFLMIRKKGDVLSYYVFIGLPIIFITIGVLRNEKDEKKRDTDLIIAGSVLGSIGLLFLYVFIRYELLNL